MRFASAVFLLAALPAFADTDPPTDISSMICPVQCNGSKKVAAFDFAAKAKSYGDPNKPAGTPLGPTVLTPKTEDNSPNDDLTPSEAAPTADAFGQLNEFENWSANNCGASLNSEGDVQVAGMCPAVKARYDRWRLNMVAKHQKTSPYHPPANKKAMDDFFNAANSPAAQEKLKTYFWIRNDAAAIDFKNCKTEGLPPENPKLFAVEISGTICSLLSAPKTVAQVVPGVPTGTEAGADTGGKASVYVFGKEFVVIGGFNMLRSPSVGLVNRSSSFSYLGESKLEEINVKAAAVKFDKDINLEAVHESQSATFTVGPVPVTVEGGIDGQAGVSLVARGTKMWANTRMTPYAKLDGYAKAYVNLFILKAGVAAKIRLLHDLLDIYAFSGVAAAPVQFNGSTVNSFIFSQQISLMNTISALQGSVDAFVKVAVPKFIGWKWKKYSTNIFSWGGLEASGYLYNHATDSAFIRNVPTKFP